MSSGAARTPPRVVAVGGGTGLSVLLSGLKREVGSRIADLAAVVAVTDDGGSSGRLRRELGVPPPGDIRNCLVALADDADLLARLFQFRFAGSEGLAGHSFGNLFLAALTEITGDFPRAILTAEQVLSVRGRILPASLVDLHLRGHGQSGRVFEGESEIGRARERLARVDLVPPDPPAFPPAIAAIEAASLVLLGPGSLYTSILPNLLIPGIREALTAARAPVLLVMNLMTQPGETDGLTALDHLRAIEEAVGPRLVDGVLVHRGALDAARLAPYRDQGAVPVVLDADAFARRGVAVIASDLLAAEGLIRHDAGKLARAALAALDRLARSDLPAAPR